MSEKPINPYDRLLARAREFEHEAIYPGKRLMWTYPKARLRDSWALTDLAERTAAADQLGWNVRLKSTAEGLEVWYEKRPMERHF